MMGARKQISGREQGEVVSVRRTLIKTLCLVLCTTALMAVARYVGPAARVVNAVARTDAWQSLYGAFGAESALQRERMIASGVVFACFLLALVIVELGDRVVRRISARR